MDEVEIQAFTADTPASKGITAAHIAQAATAYKPDTHRAPVVMGHPSPELQDAAPAFGVISGARAEGSKLFLKIKNLGQAVKDGVKNSTILHRSIAFWHPNHPSNPNPGQLSIRHLGMLGATAPGVPNMPGLAFGADDQLEATGEPADCIIFGAPAQPGALDPEQVKAIAEAVAAIIKPTEKPKGKEFAVDEAELKKQQDQLREDQKKLTDGLKALEEQQTAFAAAQKEAETAAKNAREAANTAFAATLVGAGKFPAGHQSDLVTVLNNLPTTVLDFSGDVKESPADALKRILNGGKVQFAPGQISPDGKGPEFKADDDDAEAKALAAANARAEQAWQGKA